MLTRVVKLLLMCDERDVNMSGKAVVDMSDEVDVDMSDEVDVKQAMRGC